MKVIYEICETEKEANSAVNSLMSIGYSAYRQGLTVYIDDGGVDDAL